jgi:hypothetical protein
MPACLLACFSSQSRIAETSRQIYWAGERGEGATDTIRAHKWFISRVVPPSIALIGDGLKAVGESGHALVNKMTKMLLAET